MFLKSTAFLILFAASIGCISSALATAEGPMHAIASHGEPALPADFEHLPYANPDAPKGGSISYGVVGTFDNLNPFILKSMRTTARGMWDPEFGHLTYESLMVRSRDEAFTLYGLLAESVEFDDDRTFIQFNINPLATWSDGEPVTADDVVFTFELLEEKGRPPFSRRLNRVEKMEKTGPLSVRFWLKEDAGREFPLILGISPILPAHATDAETFDRSTFEPPVTSGPYRIKAIQPGEKITFERREDYWARDLPVKRGLDNYDEISVEYFLSDSAQFEAFKKGVYDINPEGSPISWERAYDFPAIERGEIVKAVFENKLPAGMFGFVFNTRREKFEDKTLRKALAMLFDFEWVNRSLFNNAYKRTESYFQHSDLSSIGRPASDLERGLLAPFPDAVDKAVMDGTYHATRTNGSGRDRKVQREALRLLNEAGYRIEQGKLLDQADQPLLFEVMTQNEGQEKIALAYQRNLAALGIDLSIHTVDDAQYQRRSQNYDYDMIIKAYPASLSPGTEQVWRWGSQSRDIEGTFNYAGAAEPAIDAMIDAMLEARSQEAFVAAVRAFDRVLVSGYYVVPLYYLPGQRVAYRSKLEHPAVTPIYGYVLPTWWDKTASQ
ncbi:extracellular solute-binding protein [Hoeflea prorocentri]|uniref:Extracellular solute-binding protein n=1 Tax=Hoeflea prorocentri TaxID=1922333 RepID=A0A9X3UH76_9HYPH|nr:extracellular solute-binding protein [Hoeflea prorocentri]MCY6380783.1 extracellular solute-binding protein [Hoeflea prorocentri]MDA5398583.1 extracellular solute-binding protein [Hoeflea prorocentri]